MFFILQYIVQTLTFPTPLLYLPVIRLHIKIPLVQHLQPLSFPSQYRSRRRSLSRLHGILSSAEKTMSIWYHRYNAAIDKSGCFRTFRDCVGVIWRRHFKAELDSSQKMSCCFKGLLKL